MKKTIQINKSIGQTPLQAIKQYQQEHPEYANQKITYAGRLDPMAEGLLLLLVGEECKNKDNYLNFDKEYTVDILWGISTDTYDILGLISNTEFDNNKSSKISFTKRDRQLNTSQVARGFNNQTMEQLNKPHQRKKNLIKVLNTFQTSFNQPYPPYSAQPVQGKPLWQWSQERRLDEIKIPTKKITIQSIKHIRDYSTSTKKIHHYIKEKINLIQGNFRQKEILQSWEKFFLKNNTPVLSLSQIAVHCSSGTYMRSLANNIGEKLNTPALAYKIKRTKIGKYSLS